MGTEDMPQASTEKVGECDPSTAVPLYKVSLDSLSDEGLECPAVLPETNGLCIEQPKKLDADRRKKSDATGSNPSEELNLDGGKKSDAADTHRSGKPDGDQSSSSKSASDVLNAFRSGWRSKLQTPPKRKQSPSPPREKHAVRQTVVLQERVAESDIAPQVEQRKTKRKHSPSPSPTGDRQSSPSPKRGSPCASEPSNDREPASASGRESPGESCAQSSVSSKADLGEDAPKLKRLVKRKRKHALENGNRPKKEKHKSEKKNKRRQHVSQEQSASGAQEARRKRKRDSQPSPSVEQSEKSQTESAAGTQQSRGHAQEHESGSDMDQVDKGGSEDASEIEPRDPNSVEQEDEEDERIHRKEKKSKKRRRRRDQVDDEKEHAERCKKRKKHDKDEVVEEEEEEDNEGERKKSKKEKSARNDESSKHTKPRVKLVSNKTAKADISDSLAEHDSEASEPEPVPDRSTSPDRAVTAVARLRAAALQAFGLKRAKTKLAIDTVPAPEVSQDLKAKLQAKLQALKRKNGK